MPPKCAKTREPEDEQLCKLSAPYREIYINFSCSYTSFHMFHTYKYLPHNKSSYDNYNFFQNETLCHTFHNTIPEYMLHVMK